MSLLFEGDTDPAAPEGLVTLARFHSPVEAQMARGAPESAGVECFLAGENINSLLGGALRARRQVRVEDEADARAILANGAGAGAAGQEPS